MCLRTVQAELAENTENFIVFLRGLRALSGERTFGYSHINLSPVVYHDYNH